MANADYIRRKVHELKEQATRLGSDAIDGLRGSRIGGAVAPTFEELRERARRGSGSSTMPGGGGQNPIVGRQGSGVSVGSTSPPGSRPSSMTGGMYPPPPGTYPHNAGAPHGYPAAAPPVSPAAVTPQAFPAGVPVPPTRGEPAWRGPNHGVYPDISAPTAATAPHVHAAAREPLHHQGAYPAATVPAEAANGQRAHAHAAQQQSEGCQPVGANMKTAAHEPIPSAPLYVPAPNRVSAASSVPRDDLWYTSEPLAAGRASLEEPIRYPTVGELTPNASNGPNEELDEPSAADVSESTEAESAEGHVVSEVTGREQAARNADSYPNVGTSGTGSAPRERLREQAASAHTEGRVGSGGYPNVGSTGLGTAPRERVYVRASRADSVDGGYANVGTTGLGTAPAERVRPPPGIRQPGSSSHERRASTGSVGVPPQPATQSAGQSVPRPQQPQPPQQQQPQQQPQQQRPQSQPQAQQTSRPQQGPPPPAQAQQQRHQQSQQQQHQQSPAWEQTRWPPSARPPPSQPQPQVPQPPPPPPQFSTAAIMTRSGMLQLQLQLPFSSSVAPVAQVDVHPSEPWLLLTRCNGGLNVYDHGTATWPRALPKLTDRGHAVLTACFVPSKRLIATGCADGNVRVYANDTLQIVKAFDAHKTGVRCLAVHPSKPLLLSASDDGLMKLFKWDKGWDMQGWKDKQTFKGHKTAITALAFNPGGDDTFASASADQTVKIWRVGNSKPEIALKHEGGRVTCLDFCVGKPLLLTGTSGGVAKVWDYQSVACVASLEAHGSPLASVKFHSELPVILTGCEDGSIRVWDAATWKLEAVLGSGLQRIHALAPIQHSFGWSRRVVVCSDIGALMLHITRVEKKAPAAPAPAATLPHAGAETSSAGRRKDDDDDSRMCVICQDADAVAGFLHGDSLHRCVCQECAVLYKAPGAPKTCPLCNQRIEQVVMKIF